MASTFSSNKDLEKPGLGEQSGIWGQSLNTNFDKMDGSLGRTVNKSLIGNPVLSTSQTAVADFDAVAIRLSGDISSLTTRTVTFPATKGGRFLVDTLDVTFGTNKAILKVAGETRGVTITSASERVFDVYTNGTSVRRAGRVDSPYILNEIRMYAPTGGLVSANLPNGWHVCDGNNGTVDLRSRFVRGAANYSTWAVGQTGGSNTDIVSANSFKVSGFTTSTVLTSAMIPPHKHPQFADAIEDFGSANDLHNLNSTDAVAAAANRGGQDTEYAMAKNSGIPTVGLGGVQNGSGTTGHRHAVSFNLQGTNVTVSTVPAFYSIIFIQFKG